MNNYHNSKNKFLNFSILFYKKTKILKLYQRMSIQLFTKNNKY